MRVLITGAHGMLGRDLQVAFGDHDVTALDRAELDITDADAVTRVVAGHDVVVNAAAYTAVDLAESDEDGAFAVNAVGAGNLAAAASAARARMVQLSTDYVFDGTAVQPYAEDAPVHPVSAYGRTKAEGERRVLASGGDHLVVRTAWLYGAHGANFAKTMLSLARQRPTWTVVDDQWGQPTWTADLAGKIAELVHADAPAGVYHVTSAGRTTWLGFARAVLADNGYDPDLATPVASSAYPRPAARPAFSVLGHDRLTAAGLTPIRDWRDALSAATAAGVFAQV